MLRTDVARSLLDVVTSVNVTPAEARRGTVVRLQVPDAGQVPLSIQAGTQSGREYKLPGFGHRNGSQAGDLIVRVIVTGGLPVGTTPPMSNVPASDQDITVEVVLTTRQATEGAKVPVVDGRGREVQVTIRPGILDGERIRLHGCGRYVGDRAGDLYVVARIQSGVVTPQPSQSIKPSTPKPRRPSTNNPRQGAIDDAKRELDALIGLAPIKEQVARFEAMLYTNRERRNAGLPSSRQTLHFVFRGNPGTGKTTVARIFGKLLFGYELLQQEKVVETDRSGLVAEFLGQTAIKTDAKVQESLNGVLFIDEAYSLVRNNGGYADTYGLEALDTLLKRMEDLRDRLVVIVAGYPALMEAFLASNPGLQSRFTRYIVFPDYTPQDMVQIAEGMAAAAGYRFSREALAKIGGIFACAPRTQRFGNAREARNLVDDTIGRQALRIYDNIAKPTRHDLCLITPDDVSEPKQGPSV